MLTKKQNYWKAAQEVLELWSKYRKLDSISFKRTDDGGFIYSKKAYDEKEYVLNCLDSAISKFRVICSGFKVITVDRRWLFKHIENNLELCDNIQAEAQSKKIADAEPISIANLIKLVNTQSNPI